MLDPEKPEMALMLLRAALAGLQAYKITNPDAELVRVKYHPFVAQWGKRRLFVLGRRYAGTA